jgi:hypothetical protein
MSNKFTKKYSTSLAIKEIQIKTTLRFHPTIVRRASQKKKRKQNKINAGKYSGERSSYTLFVGI